MAHPYIVVDPWNQYGGSMRELRRMTLAAFQAGADAIKPQLFSSQQRFGDDSRKYLEVGYDEIKAYVEWARGLGIDVFCSAFDADHLRWCQCLGAGTVKIPSAVAHDHPSVVERALAHHRFDRIIVSTGFYKPYVFPWDDDRIDYLYCVPQYPTWLDDSRIKSMPPKFGTSGRYAGYSDHCPGIAAALEAVRRGATIIEKHITMDVNAQAEKEKAHACSFTPESLRTFCNIVREWEVMS